MAERGTRKRLSVEHEDKLAKLYDGKRSPSSGASKTDRGDVRCAKILIEAKMTKGKIPAWVEKFEKITKEAYYEGREPMLAFRFYNPDSILADSEGWIDLVVRRAGEDALREKDYVEED